MMYRIVSALPLLSLALRAQTPPMPFVFPGGCSIECCCYGQWRAVRSTKVLASRNSNSRVVFTLARGNIITAVGGDLVTITPGVVAVLRTSTLDVSDYGPLNAARQTLTVPAGDTIYTLLLTGEATDLIMWYRGRTYWGGRGFESFFAVDRAVKQSVFDVVSVPSTQWWVRVKNARGRTGWVLNPDDFRGIDACG